MRLDQTINKLVDSALKLKVKLAVVDVEVGILFSSKADEKGILFLLFLWSSSNG